jgi:ribonuclease D
MSGLVSWAEVWPRLERSRRVAFDLEGDFNLYRYGRRVCLFQLAFDDEVVLLDPLKDPVSAWDGWKDFLENPAVTKVIWAAQNDVRVLKACFGISLKGLWDLFDASCLTVTPRPTLPLLVQTFLGQTIGKDETIQTSDWSLRPLSELQLQYAAQDVRYLLALADALDPLLDEKRKRSIFETRMRTAESYVFRETDEPWRRVKGSGALDEEQVLRLKDVWLEREKLAENLDLAPWRVVPPDELLHWARTGRFSDQFQVDPRWTLR